jgi:hypothetical protein
MGPPALPTSAAWTKHHFGWGYATVSLRTKKIKGLHENDLSWPLRSAGLAQQPNG